MERIIKVEVRSEETKGKLEVRNEELGDEKLPVSSRLTPHSLLLTHRVLVAEDDFINREMVTEILKGAGILVETANSGMEAVRAVVGRYEQGIRQFDAVFMDVQMLGMDGYEATRLIRSDPRFQSLPIIAMTANDVKEDQQRCLDVGMNDYVLKPFDADQIVSTLVKWIKSGQGKVNVNSGGREEKSAEQAEEELLASLPGVNVETALNRLGGSTKLLIALLKQFAKDNKNTVGSIGEALGWGDSEAALKMAHTVKGVAGNLSIPELQTAAINLETAIKGKNQVDLSHSLNDFERAMNRTLESIGSLVSSETQKPCADKAPCGERASADLSKIFPLLNELADLLKKGSLSAEECLDALKAHLNGLGFDKEMEQLEEQMFLFDFKGALSTLDVVSQALSIFLKEGNP